METKKGRVLINMISASTMSLQWLQRRVFTVLIRSVDTVIGVERMGFPYIEPRSLPKTFKAAMALVGVMEQLVVILESNIPVKSLCDGYPTTASVSHDF